MLVCVRQLRQTASSKSVKIRESPFGGLVVDFIAPLRISVSWVVLQRKHNACSYAASWYLLLIYPGAQNSSNTLPFDRVVALYYVYGVVAL